MANNRMYLRCRTCGAVFLLAKTFCEYGTCDEYYENGMMHDLNEFLDKHNYCYEPVKDRGLEPKFEPKDVHPENRFEIAYEIYRGEEENG